MPPFFWVGNHPGLDLVNTEPVDERGRPIDLLRQPSDLLDWIDEAGLATGGPLDAARAGVTDAEADALLSWTRQLRRAARPLLDPSMATTGGAVAELDALVGAVPVRLAYPGVGPGVPLVTTGDSTDELRLTLARAVLGALALDPSRVRCCAGARCVLLFHDTSRNRSRRWCDMAVCGNRAKVATHYQRHKVGSGGGVMAAT